MEKNLADKACLVDEQSEEKMREKLIEMGNYESGMTCKEMTEFLQAIRNSSATVDSTSRNEELSISQIVDLDSETSYFGAGNSIESDRGSFSPEYSMRFGRKHTSTIAKKSQTTSKDKFGYILSEGTLSQHHTEDNGRRFHSSFSVKEEMLISPCKISNNDFNIPQATLKNHMWRIDPLDCKTVDIPLNSKKKSSKLSARSIMIDPTNGNPLILQAELKKINCHLQEVANIWHEWETHITEREFRWGAPVKVGTDNGSLDKYPTQTRNQTPEKTEALASREVASRSGEFDVILIRRSNPFRRTRSAKKSVDPYTYYDSDSDLDFAVEKKKVKVDDTPSKDTHMKRKRMAPLAGTKKYGNEFMVDNHEDREWHETCQKKSVKKRERSPEYDFVIPDAEYQKIATSPRPLTTMRLKTSAQIVENPLANTESTQIQSSEKSMKTIGIFILPEKLITRTKVNQNEIAKVPILNVDDNKERLTEVPILPLDRSNRLDISISRLQRRNHERKVWAMNKKDEETLETEGKEWMKNEELRLKTIASKAQTRVTQTMEIREKERGQHYRHIIDKAKSSFERNELVSDGDLIRPMEYVNWDPRSEIQLPSGNSSEAPKRSNDSIECPICGKSFGADDVQQHAASCVDFSTDEHDPSYVGEVIGRTSSPDCFDNNLDNFYDPHDGKVFENRERRCPKKTRNTRASGSNTHTPIVSPDSPIRSFKTINEGDNSDFYSNLFQQKKATGRISNIQNRKRKRSTNQKKFPRKNDN